MRRLLQRVEIRQKPLLALVQGLLGWRGLVEPRRQSFPRPRQTEVLKVALDTPPDRGEVVHGGGLDGGGDAIEEVGELRGGADGGC